MLRRVLLTTLLGLLAPLTAAAQETPKDDEMAFVHKLRERGYADLALDYLQTRLKGTKDQSLEIALTRAALARTEADSAKRVGLFGEARAELDDFIKKNPSHAKVGEVRLETARIASDQGKTQLARALSLTEGDENRSAEMTRAIQLLEAAGTVIEAVAAELKTDKEKNENEYERGLLLVSQGRAYLALSRIETKQQSKLEKQSADALKAAITLLEGLGERLEASDPLKGRALAWCGRAKSLNAETVGVVAAKFNEAKQASAVAKDPIAIRQIAYFEMLQLFENEQGLKPDDRVNLRNTGTRWLQAYPSYRNTAEGQGVQFILAKLYFDHGRTSTPGPTRDGAWANARAFIRNLEATDNEFTAQAAQLKIQILVEQKAFQRDIKTLSAFDDLYMRALYEHQQLGKETAKFEKPEDKKKQQQLIIDTLKRGLASAQAEIKRGLKPPEVDLSNAYYLLTGYHLAMDNFTDAAKVGEEFIRAYPRTRHSNTVAMFTARALGEVIKKGAGDDYDQMVEERERLYKLGEYMAGRWPGDKAGEYGKFIVALHLIKKPLTETDEKKREAERLKREADALKVGGDVARFHLGVERAKAKKFMECVVLLNEIKPTFSNYVLSQYQLSLAALQLDKDDAERLKDKKKTVLEEENEARVARGQKPLVIGQGKAPFKALAIEALEKIPDTVDLTDPENAVFFFRAKCQLGFQLYSLSQFDKMEQLSNKLLPVLGGLKSIPDMEKGNFQMQLNSIKLYGVYGKADTAYRASNFAQVATTLDPFVNDLAADKYPELKEDTRLLNAMLGLALRSNLQAERGKRAMEIVNVWKKFQKEGEDTIANVLTSTVISLKKQIDDLRKKGDKAKLDAVVKSLSGFLDEIKGDEKNITPDFRLLLAQCYVPIGRYPQAIELLKKYPAPKPNDEAVKQNKYKVVQVLLIRAHRLQGKETKNSKSFEEAKTLLDTIMTPTDEDKLKKQPGWGKRDINALIEETLLLMDMEAYGAAVNRCNTLLGVLGKQLGGGGKARDHYFEVSQLYVHAFSMVALREDDKTKREGYLKRVTKFFVALVHNHPTMGGDEHKESFRAFFDTLKNPNSKELNAEQRGRFAEFLATPEGKDLEAAIEKLK